MKNLKNLLILILFVIPLSTCDSVEEVPPKLQPRSFNCFEKSSDGKQVLVCTGYSRIPLELGEASTTNPLDIRVLDMSSGNHLQTLKEGEILNANFQNLDVINLANANIKTIEKGAFFGLDRLMKIDLSNNRIDSLEMEAFQNVSNLQVLFLNGNPIHQFLGTKFPLLPALKTIDLSNCQIRKVPINIFQELHHLQELNLQSNKLARLDWNVFNENPYALTHLLLHKNAWNCDCHIKFLRDFLMEARKMNISSSIICEGPESLAGITLSSIQEGDLTCNPEITALTPIGAMEQGDSDPDSNGDLIIYSEVGKDIGLECNVEGFPAVEIIWQKNGNLLTDENDKEVRDLQEEKNETDNKPHFRIDNKSLGENKPYRYSYAKVLTIHKVDKDDFAEYMCIAKNSAGKAMKRLRLNVTGILEDDDRIVVGGGGKIWLWILLGLLGLLIVALFLVCILLWRKKERERQQKLKNNMLQKFKGSEIILDETLSSARTQNNSTTVPLLTHQSTTNNLQGSTIISTLPDVAQGQKEISPNLSPVIFSPRPQTDDLRRQFFAAKSQSQLDRPSRPASAMSMVYLGSAHTQQPHRQPYQFQNRPYEYRVPNYPIRRPGSAQSLVYPENYYSSRPILTRQFSGPAYPTAMRLPPRDHRRHPTEPERYVTLPRNFPQYKPDSGFGPSVSPTESNFSSFSYSTLPRQRLNSFGGVIYDSVGPRTTLDGGSNLSLNKIGDGKYNTLDSISHGVKSPTISKARNRVGSTTTPSTLKGFFSFEPIQEVEGGSEELPSNSEMDQLFPTPKFQPHSDSKLRNQRKKAPNISAIPSRSRKPLRTFEYSKLGGIKDYAFDESLDGDKEENLPDLPTSPIPINLKSSMENIIERVEGTEV